MNSQQLILDRIAGSLDPLSITLLHDADWSNSGTLRTLDAGTLAQIARIDYNFQPGYCHFRKPNSEVVAALWYEQSDVTGKADWVRGSIPDLVDAVVAYLTGAT